MKGSQFCQHAKCFAESQCGLVYEPCAGDEVVLRPAERLKSSRKIACGSGGPRRPCIRPFILLDRREQRAILRSYPAECMTEPFGAFEQAIECLGDGSAVRPSKVGTPIEGDHIDI